MKDCPLGIIYKGKDKDHGIMHTCIREDGHSWDHECPCGKKW